MHFKLSAEFVGGLEHGIRRCFADITSAMQANK